MTAEEFLKEFMPFVEAEAYFTEDNVDSPTFMDYVADIATVAQRMMDREHPRTQATIEEIQELLKGDPWRQGS